MNIRPSTLCAAAAAFALCGCAAGSSGVRTAADSAPTSCLKDTGSRLPHNEAICTPGRSYSRSDIDATGAMTAAGALRLMDPSISVGH